MHRPLRHTSLTLAALVLAGCASPRRTDRHVAHVLQRGAATEPLITTNVMIDATTSITTPLPTTNTLTLGLEESLLLATQHSHALQSRRESLYRSGLSALGTRRSFGLDVSSTLDYVYSRDTAGNNTYSSTADLGLSRILPTGGSASIRGAAGSSRYSSADTNATETTYDSSITLQLSQPLLAGAGYEASHEALIQSRRNMVYALRSFALQRQDLALEIIRGYYNLLIQREVLTNTRRNVAQSTGLRARSEAMFKVGRAIAIDVMRARQQELAGQNQLAQAEASFDIALRRFILELGLSASLDANLVGDIPPPAPLDLDEEALVKTALARRLDLLTVRNQVDDAARHLRQSKSNLLPELNVYGQVNMADSGTDSIGDQNLEDSYSAGVSLEIPLDKRDERDAVRLAMIDLDQARREMERKADEVRLDVRDSVTRLKYLRNSVAIEKSNIEIAERRARNALIRFRNGELLNRDVVEAETELLSARNSYVRVLADYEVQRIRLLRNAGLLDVAPSGLIIEGEPE